MTRSDPPAAKIAVLMAVHGAADPSHFEEAIQSIQSQTYSDYAIYLYCDGPLGSALEGIVNARLLQGESQHVVVQGEAKVGLPRALNVLIDRALADPAVQYFGRMDADDVSVDTRFAKQVFFLTAHPEVDIVGSWCIEFTDPGVPLFHKQLPTNPDEVGAFMLFRSPLAHPAVMFRRSVFEAGFRYDPQLLQAQDYEFWSRLYCGGCRISNVPEYLLWYRLAKDFYARRSGISRALAEFRMRLNFARKSGQFKAKHILGFLALFAIRVAPAAVKKFSYKHFRKV